MRFIRYEHIPPPVPFEIEFIDVYICMQKIEEAGEKGELTELVLMVIWNRLDLARRDVSWWRDGFNISALNVSNFKTTFILCSICDTIVLSIRDMKQYLM